MKNEKEVGLFGTCNDSQWREALIPLLNCKYYNPVVKDWNEEAQRIELEKRQTCDYMLFVITPKMTGMYAIAEVTQDSCIRPETTLFCVLENDDENEFTEHQLKSMKMVKNLIRENGARVFESLQDIAEFLNYVTAKP